MRKLASLLALLATLGLVSVSASGAEAEESSLPPTEAAPASMAECPSNAVCVWSGQDFNGFFSWWSASETGCHNHADNPLIGSAWNRSGYRVRLGGWGYLASGRSEPNLGQVNGAICWPE